jgi:hypothetical protein
MQRGFQVKKTYKDIVRGSKKNKMSRNWLWKVYMVPACLILFFGILGLVYPTPYMEFYLQHTAHTSIAALSAMQPDVLMLLGVIFRANGLGMTMSSILAIFVIWFAYRKGANWAGPALFIAGGIGIIGEIILEVLVL